MKQWLSYIVLIGCFITHHVNAGIVVIVHAENFENINANQLRALYLGKSDTFPSGAAVTTYDFEATTKSHQEFVNNVLNRSEDNLSAYWARMLFSSKARPPEVLKTPQEMIERVTMDKTALGYVLEEDFDKQSKVRVLLTFK